MEDGSSRKPDNGGEITETPTVYNELRNSTPDESSIDEAGQPDSTNAGTQRTPSREAAPTQLEHQTDEPQATTSITQPPQTPTEGELVVPSSNPTTGPSQHQTGTSLANLRDEMLYDTADQKEEILRSNEIARALDEIAAIKSWLETAPVRVFAMTYRDRNKIEERINSIIMPQKSGQDEVGLQVKYDKVKKVGMVYGNINLDDLLVSAKGLKLPQYFNGNLYIKGPANAEGLEFPKAAIGDMRLDLVDYSGLKFPEYFRGNIEINDVRNNIEGLEFPQEGEATIHLRAIYLGHGISGMPDDMLIEDYNRILEKGVKADRVVFPRSVVGFSLERFTELSNSILPQKTNNNAWFKGLTKVENVKFPRAKKSEQSGDWESPPSEVGGELLFDNLEIANNFELPNKVSSGLYIPKLKEAKNIVMPDEVPSIDLPKITTLEGIDMSKTILSGSLVLESVKSIDSISASRLPKIVEGGIYLEGLGKEGREELRQKLRNEERSDLADKIFPED